MAPQQSPAPKRDERDERAMRDQESRFYDDVHEIRGDAGAFHQRGPLPDIPARPGFVQRWVAVPFPGKEDPATVSNLAKRQREGWRPRNPDNVAKNLYPPRLTQGEWTGCIGIQGMVLMERPVAFHLAARAETKRRLDQQMDSVRTDLRRVHNPDAEGFGAPTLTHKSRTDRGRVPVVVDDDDGE